MRRNRRRAGTTRRARNARTGDGGDISGSNASASRSITTACELAAIIAVGPAARSMTVAAVESSNLAAVSRRLAHTQMTIAGGSKGRSRFWREAKPITGTLAEDYLCKRGLAALPDCIHDVLRWHPRCPWEGTTHPCMVALFSDAVTGEPRAIHRTAISAIGEKIDRKYLGPVAGCVIRLWSDEFVTDGLVLGEGVETVLAAATRVEHRGALLQPAWAAGDANNVRQFPVLPGIEALTLLVDNDASGGGQDAAEECARRWVVAGREVTRLTPRITGEDFNDITRRKAS